MLCNSCFFSFCLHWRRRHYAILTPKFALDSPFWKPVRSNWNFDALCRMVYVVLLELKYTGRVLVVMLNRLLDARILSGNSCAELTATSSLNFWHSIRRGQWKNINAFPDLQLLFCSQISLSAIFSVVLLIRNDLYLFLNWNLFATTKLIAVTGCCYRW